MAEFSTALIDRDIERALNLLTDDVVMFYSNGSAIVGKNAFAAVMTNFAVHELSAALTLIE